ncbi:hypothetical protein POM88_043070 [Heracleum sosnowskyi]|uniref:Uncharacterized protein n=1 Tax=Heracleum sosnowskyi TaxID=360622 RepID=A0AAD8H1A9_9APIA|nr:hypothetical protein POM88_043070 [Heracleum sosnowskyi]
MIILSKKRFEALTSNPKKYWIYPKDVDISRVPQIFNSLEDGDGVYFFPQDDIELLDWLEESRPSLRHRYSVDKFNQLEIYTVKVDTDKVTVEKCLELLKGIDCESRFLACSVEKPYFFFAELNEDDATRLKGQFSSSSLLSRANKIGKIKKLSKWKEKKMIILSKKRFEALTSNPKKIYTVKVDVDKVTVKKCLELLKGIDCESRFLACSVEKPYFFFAELNEDDATRLKGQFSSSSLLSRANKIRKIKKLSNWKEKKMIILSKKRFEVLTSNPKKYWIYPKDVDISRVPRIFNSLEDGDGVYFFPQDDIELLDWLKESRPSLRHRYSLDKFNQLEIYTVKMDADKVTVEKCLELLKGIDCESRFLACSVEKPSFFFVELNEDDATRLKGQFSSSSLLSRANKIGKIKKLSKWKEKKMIILSKKRFEALTSNPNKYWIYPKDVDISRVPQIFDSLEDEDGVYFFPQDDIELLDWLNESRPLLRHRYCKP